MCVIFKQVQYFVSSNGLLLVTSKYASPKISYCKNKKYNVNPNNSILYSLFIDKPVVVWGSQTILLYNLINME